MQTVRLSDLKRVAKTVHAKADNGSATRATVLDQSARKVITQWLRMDATNVSVRTSSGTVRRTIVKLNVLTEKKHVLIANPAYVTTDAGPA